jgi:hypothetical protein
MIRKLKVGEVIREGDFIDFAGLKIDLCEDSEIVGENVDGESKPIFREIPDSFHALNLETLTISHMHAEDMKKSIAKSDLIAYANWILEVAEFIEEGDQL